MAIEQTTLRDTLAAALTAAEPETTATQSVIEPAQQTESQETRTARERDESGRFASKNKENKPEAQETASTVTQTENTVETPKASRPSTWKKDYWEKFDALDPELQNYIHQRETEYKTGVSTYRAEAERAKELHEAIAPFIPDLQRNNISPSQWIGNLGRAHQTLVYGNPMQKAQMFARMAQEYGVDLNQLGQYQQQIDPQSQWLMQQVSTLSQDLNSFKSQQQAAEQQALQSEIGQFAANAPHFEMVRETMAGLLQAGMAQDLQSAYDKAVRLNDEAWQAEQERLSHTSTQQQATAAAKAKSVAVSPKSGTPVGTTKAVPGKGLRETIAAQLDAASARV